MLGQADRTLTLIQLSELRGEEGSRVESRHVPPKQVNSLNETTTPGCQTQPNERLKCVFVCVGVHVCVRERKARRERELLSCHSHKANEIFRVGGFVRALVSEAEIKASCLPTKMLPVPPKDTNHTVSQEQKIKSISVFFKQRE